MIEQMYRGEMKEGQWISADKYLGGLAGAVRREVATGEKVGEKSHFTKGYGRLTGLKRILESGMFKGNLLNAKDMAIVRALHDDLLLSLPPK